MGPSTTPRLLVVVAHPDDETFGCGSILLNAAARGAVTAVCCATRGEAGQIAPGLDVEPDDLGDLRERELREAAQIMGVTQVDLLGFLDSGMSGPADPETLVGADVDDVRDRVRTIIESFEPTILVTLDGGDGHRDHARIRDATLAAVEAAEWQVDRVYLHSLPKSLMQRWVDHMARENPTWEHLSGDVPGTPDEQITTVVDATQYLAERERAIAAHASQASPFEGLPADLLHEFLATDRLQRVRPPWTGGDRETDVFAVSSSSEA